MARKVFYPFLSQRAILTQLLALTVARAVPAAVIQSLLPQALPAGLAFPAIVASARMGLSSTATATTAMLSANSQAVARQTGWTRLACRPRALTGSFVVLPGKNKEEKGCTLVAGELATVKAELATVTAALAKFDLCWEDHWVTCREGLCTGLVPRE